MSKSIFLLVLSIVFGLIYHSLGQETPFWGYDCVDSQCITVRANESNIDSLLSLNPCVLKCNEFGTLWPRPTNVTTWNNTLLNINRTSVTIRQITPMDFTSYWELSMNRFNKIIDTKIGDTHLVDGEYSLSISLYVESDSMNLDLDTDEQYQLQIENNGNEIDVLLRSFNYFGARHALETLSQLITFDEFSSQLKILSNVSISDGPAYKYRGVLVDTARAYHSVDAIKRTLDVMAMSKLNVFNWHITDAQSFAMVLNSHPELSQKGAYSSSQAKKIEFVYTASHVAAGFQDTNLVTCLFAQPWESCNPFPPCGHLDPTNDEVYELLHDIYSEMNEIFENPVQFHMGGYMITASCWNSSSDVRDWMIDRVWELTDDGYLKLMSYFQGRALAIYRNITQDDRKPILSSSTLTEEENIDEYLTPDDYVIHVLNELSGEFSQVPHLLEKGYDVIISNSDALFLNRGFGNWRDSGTYSTYNPWHRIYDNDFRSVAGNRTSQILGGLACSWSETAGEGTLDALLWPRASALGERLWSEPNTNFRGAENRILLHREFLVQYGINAESIQPLWCVQNLGGCPYN